MNMTMVGGSGGDTGTEGNTEGAEAKPDESKKEV